MDVSFCIMNDRHESSMDSSRGSSYVDHVDCEVCTWVYVYIEQTHTLTRSQAHSKPKLYNMTTSDQIHNISFVFECVYVFWKSL